jgi:hypothetical protein
MPDSVGWTVGAAGAAGGGNPDRQQRGRRTRKGHRPTTTLQRPLNEKRLLAPSRPPECPGGPGKYRGRCDLIEGWFSPGVQTPLHRHGAYSEQLYVLDREFTVWAGGHKVALSGRIPLQCAPWWRPPLTRAGRRVGHRQHDGRSHATNAVTATIARSATRPGRGEYTLPFLIGRSASRSLRRSTPRPGRFGQFGRFLRSRG